MVKGKLISESEVKAIGQELAALKPKNLFTAETVVYSLLDEIEQAFNGGYTSAEVCKLIANKGVPMTESSFKVYLRKARKRRSEEKGNE